MKLFIASFSSIRATISSLIVQPAVFGKPGSRKTLRRFEICIVTARVLRGRTPITPHFSGGKRPLPPRALSLSLSRSCFQCSIMDNLLPALTNIDVTSNQFRETVLPYQQWEVREVVLRGGIRTYDGRTDQPPTLPSEDIQHSEHKCLARVSPSSWFQLMKTLHVVPTTCEL